MSTIEERRAIASDGVQDYRLNGAVGTRVFLQPIAAPSILGLFGFAAATWEEKTPDGAPANRTTAIAHLGGATLDNEENYLIKKLFAGGLGMVAISNPARI